MTTPNSVGRYDIGDLVQLRATIIGTDNVTPAQPSWFAFLVKNPAGTVATYVFNQAGASVANPGTGAFFKDLTLDAAGSWFYRAAATGIVQAAEEFALIVDSSFVL